VFLASRKQQDVVSSIAEIRIKKDKLNNKRRLVRKKFSSEVEQMLKKLSQIGSDTQLSADAEIEKIIKAGLMETGGKVDISNELKAIRVSSSAFVESIKNVLAIKCNANEVNALVNTGLVSESKGVLEVSKLHIVKLIKSMRQRVAEMQNSDDAKKMLSRIDDIEKAVDAVCLLQTEMIVTGVFYSAAQTSLVDANEIIENEVEEAKEDEAGFEEDDFLNKIDNSKDSITRARQELALEDVSDMQTQITELYIQRTDLILKLENDIADLVNSAIDVASVIESNESDAVDKAIKYTVSNIGGSDELVQAIKTVPSISQKSFDVAKVSFFATSVVSELHTRFEGLFLTDKKSEATSINKHISGIVKQLKAVRLDDNPKIIEGFLSSVSKTINEAGALQNDILKVAEGVKETENSLRLASGGMVDKLEKLEKASLLVNKELVKIDFEIQKKSGKLKLDTQNSVSEIFLDIKKNKTKLIAIGVFALIFSLLIAWLISSNIKKALAKIKAFVGTIRQGAFEARLNSSSSVDFVLVAKELNGIAEMLQQRSELAAAISKGDISKNVSLVSKYDKLGEALQRLINNLNATIQRVGSAAMHVGRGSNHLAKVSNVLSQGANSQTELIKKVTEITTTVSEQIQYSNEAATEASALMVKTTKSVEAGTKAGDAMTVAMGDIANSSSKVAKKQKPSQNPSI